MEEEKEISQEEPGILIAHSPNVHFLICITGKIINKEYERKIKRFLFRVITTQEFVENSTHSVERIIFQFGILKKLHRKYRKILYNGNHVSVGGVIKTIVAGEDENGMAFQQYFIDVMAVSEAKAEMPNIPESPEI